MDASTETNPQPQIGQRQRDSIIRVERILMAPCCYTQTSTFTVAKSQRR